MIAVPWPSLPTVVPLDPQHLASPTSCSQHLALRTQGFYPARGADTRRSRFRALSAPARPPAARTARRRDRAAQAAAGKAAVRQGGGGQGGGRQGRQDSRAAAAGQAPSPAEPGDAPDGRLIGAAGASTPSRSDGDEPSPCVGRVPGRAEPQPMPRPGDLRTGRAGQQMPTRRLASPARAATRGPDGFGATLEPRGGRAPTGVAPKGYAEGAG